MPRVLEVKYGGSYEQVIECSFAVSHQYANRKDPASPVIDEFFQRCGDGVSNQIERHRPV
jgi:hypothetical protein